MVSFFSMTLKSRLRVGWRGPAIGIQMVLPRRSKATSSSRYRIPRPSACGQACRPGEIYLGWTRVGEALAGELRGRNARTQQQLSIAVGSRLSAQQEEVGAISTAPKREKNNERSLRELVATASTLAHILLRGFQKRERRRRQSSGIHPPRAREENFAQQFRWA